MSILRSIVNLFARRHQCEMAVPHMAHDGCPGVCYLRCAAPDTRAGHPPHKIGPGVWCLGAGLLSVCPHGTKVLDDCPVRDCRG